MHSLRLKELGAFSVSFVLAAGQALIACGGQDGKAAAYDGVGSTAAVGGSETGGAGGASEPPADGQHHFDVVEAPPSDCVELAAAPIVPDLASGPVVYRRLVAVQGHWLAEAAYDSGFARLTLEGTPEGDALIQIGDLDRVASLGKEALIASVDTKGVVWATDDGATQSAPASLADGAAFEIALGSSGDKGLAVWADFGTVRAHLLDADGPIGSTLALLENVQGDSFQPGVAGVKRGFVVAFSMRNLTDGHSVTRVAATTVKGLVTPSSILYESVTPHQVVDVAGVAKGAALLVNDAGGPFVAPLDDYGGATGDAVRLGEAGTAYGMVSDGEHLLVAMHMPDGRDAVRLLGPDAKPLGRWACLGATSGDGEHAVALGYDGQRFGVLYQDGLGKARLLRVSDTELPQ